LREVDIEQGVFRLRPTREKRKNGVGEFGADRGRQLLSRRASHTRDAAELRQQLAPSPWTNARHIVELRAEISHGPRLPVEGDGEPMGFVAHALHEQ
jgi:hypothetical protein